MGPYFFIVFNQAILWRLLSRVYIICTNISFILKVCNLHNSWLISRQIPMFLIRHLNIIINLILLSICLSFRKLRRTHSCSFTSLSFDARKSNREQGMRKMYQKRRSGQVRGQKDQRGCVICETSKDGRPRGSSCVHTCVRIERSFAKSIAVLQYMLVSKLHYQR